MSRRAARRADLERRSRKQYHHLLGESPIETIVCTCGKQGYRRLDDAREDYRRIKLARATVGAPPAEQRYAYRCGGSWHLTKKRDNSKVNLDADVKAESSVKAEQ